MDDQQLSSQFFSTIEQTTEGNNKVNNSETWEPETGTFHIKHEILEEDWSTVDLPDNSRENTGTLDVKVEYSEECSTVSYSDKSRDDAGRLAEVELSEQDCSMMPSTLMTYHPDDQREDTGTLNIKVESQEDSSTCPITPIISGIDNPTDSNAVANDTVDIKVEISEENSSTFPVTPIMSGIDNPVTSGALDMKVEVPEEDSSTFPVTPIMSGIDNSVASDTVDIKVEIPEEDSSTFPVTPIMSGINNSVASDTVDIKIEIPEEDSSTVPVTPIMSGIDNSVTSGALDIKVEIPEEDSSTFPVTPIISGIHHGVDTDGAALDIIVEISEPPIPHTDKPKDTGKQDKVQTAKKPAVFLSTPIIFLPDDLAEDINKFDFKVQFADQDWSTVPSKPKSYLAKKKNVTGVSNMNPIKPKSFLRAAKGLVPSSQNIYKPKNVCVPLKTPLPVIKKAEKLSAKRKRKRAALIAHGVPEEMAMKLCVLPLPDILEKFPALKSTFPNGFKPIQANQVSQTPVINAPKSAPIGTDKPKCMELAQDTVPASRTNEHRTDNPKGFSPLRVGIQNTKPMDKEQMTMVHRHLVLAIAELGKGGGGPEFLNFQQMDGWVMVTCVDQRSRVWLVDQLKYLKLWPGAQLSIMPEQKLAKQGVIKVVAYIPESEATDVQEALALLKAQNKGLNTQQWKILNERLYVGKIWSILFNIDEPSLETLKTQNCKAAIGFKRMSFKIITEGASYNCKSQFSKNQGPTSQKPHFSAAAGHEMPVGSGVKTYPVESQNFISQNKSHSARREKGEAAVTKRATSSYLETAYRKSDGDKNSYAPSSRPIYSKEPSTLTTGRPNPRAGGNAQSVIEDSRTENSQGPTKDKPKIIAIEHIIYAAKDRIKELRQKTQTREYTTTSEPNGSQSVASRWDETPSQTGRKRPLEARDRDTALPMIDYSKRQREETSMSAGYKKLPAARNQNSATKTNFSSQATRENIAMMPQTAQCITSGSSGIGAPTVVTLGRSGTGGITVSQQNRFCAQTIGGDPNMVPASSGVPAAVLMGNGTGGATVTQHNVFSAQATGGNVAMAPPMVIPGYRAPSVVNLATNGAGAITVTRQNIPMVSQSMVPGYVAPTMVNLATGAGGITVPSQNDFSALGSEIQAMDYFLGPGGGSQFIQNQMMLQTSLGYGVVPQQTALAMYPMYQYPNQYMNSYQAPQNGMSTLNQEDSQESSVIAEIYKDIDEHEASRDSDDSRTREDSEEGFYSSWIIQDADSFAESIAEHNALTPATGQISSQTTSRYGTQINEDPKKHVILSFTQDSGSLYVDTHSRSIKERVPPQDSNLFSRRSPQGNSGRVQDLEHENYESSPCKDRTAVREDRKLSPQARSGYYSSWIKDPVNYGRSGREERDVTDRPLIPDSTLMQAGSKSGYSNLVVPDANRRISREEDNRGMRPRQENNDYKRLVMEDARSSDKSRISEREREQLRSDRRSPQRTTYKPLDTQDARSRDTRDRVRDSPSKAQIPRERYGFIRNRRDDLPREPTHQLDRGHEVRPRR